MATIKEVAEKAGVSIATVSNFLNATKPVSREKGQRIRNAIEELNYIPNLTAKNLKSNQYSDIGVILPNFDDSYYVQIFQGIDLFFQNTNHFLNLAFTNDIPELEERVTEDFIKKQIQGIIMVTCRPDDWKYYHQHFKSQDKAVVLIDRQIHDLDASFVSFDYYAAMLGLTQNMLLSGYEDLYLFSGPREFDCEQRCVDGFLDACREYGVHVPGDHLVQVRLNKEDAFRNIISILKNHTPGAILATSESCAEGIIEGLALLKHNVPGEIPVITLGEDHWNRYTHTFATYSANRPAIRMGGQAAKIISEQMKTPKTFESRQIINENTVPPRKKIAAREKIQYTAQETSIRALLLETSQSHALLGLLPRFEKETGIRVECELLPHQAFFGKLLEEHSDPKGHAQSDVYMFNIPWLRYLAHAGFLADISGYVQDPAFDTTIYLGGCLEYFSEYQGKYYGLPFLYAPQILYYRKDLFTDTKIRADYEKKYHLKLRSPRTWTEYNAIAEFFTVHCDEIEYGAAVPASFSEYLIPEIYVRLWSYGGSILENNQVVLDSPSTLKAFINLKSTFKYAKKDYMEADDVSVVKDFLNNKIAMLITYPSFLTDIEDLQVSGMKGNVGYSHIPGKNSILGGWSMGINAHSRKREDAFQFIQWACTKQIGNYFPLLGGYPAITSVYTNDELMQLYPWLPLCLSAYDYSRPITPPISESKSVIRQSEIEAIICKWFYLALNDTVELAAAVSNAHKEIELLLKR